MKKLLIVSILLLSYALVIAQNVNNVTIETKVKNEGFDGTMTWYLKDGKIALDILFQHEGTSYESRLIPDLNKGLLNILTHTGGIKLHTVTEISNIEPAKNFDRNIIDIEDKGNVEFSGIMCKKLIIRTAATITECYIDPSINFSYYSYESFFKSDHALLALKDLRMKGFPLYLKTTDLEGRIINSVETTNIRANSVSDDIFKIGSGYMSIEESMKPIREE